jgi:hypothetical protein
MMHLCELQDMLIWNGPEPQVGIWGQGKPSTQSFILFDACKEGMDVGYLLMAKLDAIRTLGNPPWPGEQQHSCFAGRKVVLSEGHDFFVITDKEANASELM